jgi:hypothetical protein
MHIGSEFRLPLSQEQFRYAVGVGLGRARLHVDGFGAQSVRDEILEAATTCKVHDPQVDGIPARWLAELCIQGGLAQVVTERPASGSYWDRYLRCALLKELVSLGFEPARAALYAACERDSESSAVFACTDIVDLDGEEGLLFAARTLGHFLDTDAGFRVNDELMRYFDDQHGEGRAAVVLGAQVEAAIRRYLDGVALTTSRRSATRPRDARKTGDEVASAILAADQFLDWLWFWGRRASEDELEPVLRLATPSAPPMVLENVLWCLGGAKRPPIKPWLFELLEHGELNVRRYCAETLGRHVLPQVRAAGLAALHGDLFIAIALLCQNAVQEDAAAIVGALRPIEDRDDQHMVASTLMDMLRDNDSIFDSLIALYVYESSPCMHCRASAVRALEAHRSVPQWLRVECAYDASEEIRQILAGTENAT